MLRTPRSVFTEPDDKDKRRLKYGVKDHSDLTQIENAVLTQMGFSSKRWAVIKALVAIGKHSIDWEKQCVGWFQAGYTAIGQEMCTHQEMADPQGREKAKDRAKQQVRALGNEQERLGSVAVNIRNGDFIGDTKKNAPKSYKLDFYELVLEAFYRLKSNYKRYSGDKYRTAAQVAAAEVVAENCSEKPAVKPPRLRKDMSRERAMYVDRKAMIGQLYAYGKRLRGAGLSAEDVCERIASITNLARTALLADKMHDFDAQMATLEREETLVMGGRDNPPVSTYSMGVDFTPPHRFASTDYEPDDLRETGAMSPTPSTSAGRTNGVTMQDDPAALRVSNAEYGITRTADDQYADRSSSISYYANSMFEETGGVTSRGSLGDDFLPPEGEPADISSFGLAEDGGEDLESLVTHRVLEYARGAADEGVELFSLRVVDDRPNGPVEAEGIDGVDLDYLEYALPEIAGRCYSRRPPLRVEVEPFQGRVAAAVA